MTGLNKIVICHDGFKVILVVLCLDITFTIMRLVAIAGVHVAMYEIGLSTADNTQNIVSYIFLYLRVL